MKYFIKVSERDFEGREKIGGMKKYEGRSNDTTSKIRSKSISQPFLRRCLEVKPSLYGRLT